MPRPNASSASRPIELWGGIECTINRVGDTYFDQVKSTGHDARPSDLDQIAELGIRTIRYPVLWERVFPSGSSTPDWSFTDERLGRLLELGIEPVVGLVHHGSGPPTTDLLDARFAEKLAAFGDAVARRYPWVRKFTPVNEPVTTARFSGLYGHWYPHRRDDHAFANMVFNECRATVLTMEAIRSTTPVAELIQTEDAGTTFSTLQLRHQAEFENHRRWLSFDLLLGRVGPRHPLWRYLAENGVSERGLDGLTRKPCVPGVVGLNYYLTSDRYLDHEVDHYRGVHRGGNGRDVYVDVAAARARAEGIAGHAAVLLEAWHRYGIAVALTEVHLGCSREEQLRWLIEAWKGARAAEGEGAEVRAVTAWALFGSRDWDSLVTEERGHYEPGAFDIRSRVPRCTAVGKALGELARRGEFEHPVISAPGWWRRPSRMTNGTSAAPACPLPASRPLLITGATGTLGSAFAKVCSERGLDHVVLCRREMDIADPDSVDRALRELRPWAVVNAAGFVRVDEAESDPDACFRENTRGPLVLGRACKRLAIGLLSFSSDLVFDGRKSSAYVESDRPFPLGVYGQAKAEAERELGRDAPEALIIRTSAFFGPWDNHHFVAAVLRTVRGGEIFRASQGVVSPTYVPDLCHASLDLLLDGERGVWHLANRGETSWADFARRAALLASLDPELVEACEDSELGYRAARPRHSVLASERGWLMPTLDDALGRYFRDIGPVR